MNMFKKSFTLFSLQFLFILGLSLISGNKVEAVVIVTVNASPRNVISGGTSKITWTSTGGATFCTTPSKPGVTLPASDTINGFNIGPLYSNTTVTINCTAPAYCSGVYRSKQGFAGHTEPPYSNWGSYDSVISNRSCTSVADAANAGDGYKVSSSDSNWHRVRCGPHEKCVPLLGCAIVGARWYETLDGNYGPGFNNTTPCSNFNTSQSSCQSNSGCTWNP